MDQEDFLKNLSSNLRTKSTGELKDERFISAVAGGKIKFLSVVESLEGILTDENVNIRLRGIEFLSWVLTEVPENLFSATEIVYVVNFYCDCLKGNHNLLPATFTGLLGLVKMKSISNEEIIKVLVNIFQHVNCATQLQADRLTIYQILQIIILKHLAAVKPMGPDFVFGLITCIEGETDPHCLLLIFNFLPLFINQFSLGHLSEELFEILSLYFPIDFNRAVVDNSTITREDLAENLFKCLTSNQSFCEQCLPLIFEKLDSTFKNARIDSYKLLQKCCGKLNDNNIERYLKEFLQSVQKDALPGTDAEICEASLLALTDIVWLLSKEDSNKDILNEFLSDIIEGIKSFISRIDSNMFQSGMRILMAVSAKSVTATGRVLCFLKPFFQINNTRSVTDLKAILSNIVPLLKSNNLGVLAETGDPEQISSHTELVNFYINLANVATDYEVRRLAFLGIQYLLPNFNEESRKQLNCLILENIKSKEDIKTSKEILSVLRLLADRYPKELQDVLLLNVSSIGTENVDLCADRRLWMLSVLADMVDFTEFCVRVLLDSIVNGPHYMAGLESLLNACKCAKTNCASGFYEKIEKELKALTQMLNLPQKWNFDGRLNEKTLAILSEIIALITRNQSLHMQQTIIDKFFETKACDFLNSNVAEGCNVNHNGYLKNTDQLIALLEAVLGSLCPEVKIPNTLTICTKLISKALLASDESVRISSARLLAALVNKTDESSAVSILELVKKETFRKLEMSPEMPILRNCAHLYTWTVKGVVLRGGPSYDECISQWFDLLGRPEVGQAAAESFSVVFSEHYLYLNSDSHCNIRILYRQRLYENFPKLLKMYETSNEAVQSNYLLAMMQLLQGIPDHLIQREINSVIHPLVRCLNTEKAEVLLIALEILARVLEKREKILVEHVTAFVPRFLQLAQFIGNMKIRMKALQCLYFYGFYSTFALIPFKTEVLRALEYCLDDKKRLVRKEAVRARCRWFLIGAPGEDILQS